ncbi:TPA: hypothetical protein SIA39_004157, partial [Aeromonas sobria]|nr:hypothetical protein [Aeromonas sobria]
AQGFRDGPASNRSGSPLSLTDTVFPDLKHSQIKAGIDMMDAFFRQAERYFLHRITPTVKRHLIIKHKIFNGGLFIRKQATYFQV